MLASSLGSGGQSGRLNPLYQIGGPRLIQLALIFSSKQHTVRHYSHAILLLPANRSEACGPWLNEGPRR